MKGNSKQLFTKSKATTTPMSLQSNQLPIQNTPKTPNETNNNEELVNICQISCKGRTWRPCEKILWNSKVAFGNS